MRDEIKLRVEPTNNINEKKNSGFTNFSCSFWRRDIPKHSITRLTFPIYNQQENY